MKQFERNATVSQLALGIYLAIFGGYTLFSELLLLIGENPASTGYFTAAIVIGFLVFGFYYLALGRDINVNIIDILFLVFMIYVGLVNGLAYAHNVREISVGNFSYLVKFLCLYFIARNIYLDNEPKLPLTVFLILSAYVIVKSLLNGFVFYYGFSEIAPFDNDYQGAALSYVALYALALGSTRCGFAQRAALHIVSMLCLGFIGSRSEFFAVFFSIFIFEIMISRRRLNVLVMSTLFVFALVFVALVYPELFGDRVAAVLAIVSDGEMMDRSTIERLRYSIRAFEAIAENPIVGNFGSYPVGEYSHNFLSIWVDYGLIGVLIFFSIMGTIFLAIVSGLEYRDSRYALVSFLWLYLVIMFLMAKNYNYVLFPVALGLISTIIFSNREIDRAQ